MSFPKYDRYKESGVEWLGEVPEHWGILKLKRICLLKSGENITSEQIQEEGNFPVFGGNGLRGYANNYTHDGYFALIGRQGALCGNINYATGQFWASEHAVVVSETRNSITRWLGELLRAMDLNRYSIASAQPGLSVEVIGNLSIPYPPLSEQRSIATFLDRETAKIDELIAEQQRLIDLLKEKRQAVISHAVTKGLNPDVPMKETAIEWLGEVPEGWQVRALRTLSAVVRGASPRPAGDPRFFGGDVIPWVTVAEITKDNLSELLETEDFLTEDGAQNSRQFKKGTLIYSNSGATLGVPKVLQIDACANDGVVGFENLSSEINILFLYYFLSSITNSIREKVKQGSGQPNLNTDIVKAISLALPPVVEQQVIVEHIERMLSKFGLLIIEAQHAIDLLQERRTALISAAVTGKIDIRSFV